MCFIIFVQTAKRYTNSLMKKNIRKVVSSKKMVPFSNTNHKLNLVMLPTHKGIIYTKSEEASSVHLFQKMT